MEMAKQELSYEDSTQQAQELVDALTVLFGTKSEPVEARYSSMNREFVVRIPQDRARVLVEFLSEGLSAMSPDAADMLRAAGLI
jgi:uncharacterized protein YpmB